MGFVTEVAMRDRDEQLTCVRGRGELIASYHRLAALIHLPNCDQATQVLRVCIAGSSTKHAYGNNLCQRVVLPNSHTVAMPNGTL